MAAAQQSGKRTWIVVAVMIALPALLVCAICGFCVYALRETQSSVEGAATEAQRFRGRPLGECYDEAVVRMLRCGDQELLCKMDGQALFMECTRVADPDPDFCGSTASTSDQCADQCRGEADAQSCAMVCGQLSVPVRQHCGAAARP